MNNENENDLEKAEAAFLRNYDVEQEQQDLGPLALALQVFVTVFAQGFPAFWAHINGLGAVDHPDAFQWPESKGAREEEQPLFTAILKALSALSIEEQTKIKEKTRCGGNAWAVPLEVRLELNGRLLPIQQVLLEYKKGHFQVCEVLLWTESNEMEETYYQHVKFLDEETQQWQYKKAKNAATSVPRRKSASTEEKPCVVVWDHGQRMIQNVRFLNEKGALSRQTGPAEIAFKRNADGRQEVASEIWLTNGSAMLGIEHYRERRRVWREQLQLVEALEGIEQTPHKVAGLKKKL